MKLSNQAIGALLMTLQKSLAEEQDITELLANWTLKVENNEVIVLNPPSVAAPKNKISNTPVFETE